MEKGICTDKNFYGKLQFHVAAVDNRWAEELLHLEENFATNPCVCNFSSQPGWRPVDIRTRFYNCCSACKKITSSLINMKIKFDTVMKVLFPVRIRDWTKWPRVSPVQSSGTLKQCTAQWVASFPQTFHYFTDNYCCLIPRYLGGLDSVGNNWNMFFHQTLLSKAC